MTRFRTIAEEIKKRIEAKVPELAGLVILHYGNSTEAEFDKRMGMTKGKCVIVRLIRERRASPGNKTALYVGVYTVTLFTIPVLTAKDPAKYDDLMSATKEALQGWWPEGVTSPTTWFLDCLDVEHPIGTFKLRDGTSDCAAAVMTVLAPGNLK